MRTVAWRALLYFLTVFVSVPSALAAEPWCRIPSLQTGPVLTSLVHQLERERNRLPAPLPRLHTEGTLPHEGLYDESVEAKRDLPLMQKAALVWRVTHDTAWLNVARRYLLAWVTTYHPSFNPIDETSFDALIDTYAIIDSALLPADRALVKASLEKWASGYGDAMEHADSHSTWRNNWQSHRVKLVTMMAVALGDDVLFEKARLLFRKQIMANIAPNGETLDFRERDALHYVVYDLQPLIQAALAARTRGEDWYHWTTGQGASLAKAIGWLTTYVSGEKPHEEFVHSVVRFDALRARAGLKGYSGIFDPRSAGALYWLASEFDPSLRALAEKLQAVPVPFISLCGQ
ncbi:alginate lyase family protein [Acetobacter sp. P1H12_c]|uniref:alginate lyase family protein n=1 Tax=Acetobacter sp. P1H12_c TaxID=2762621 RepID=UPI001C045B83|nr:alginate lyase family protein [Acetobacter sp. P1H12_c]